MKTGDIVCCGAGTKTLGITIGDVPIYGIILSPAITKPSSMKVLKGYGRGSRNGQPSLIYPGKTILIKNSSWTILDDTQIGPELQLRIESFTGEPEAVTRSINETLLRILSLCK
jgi:hypothetical protein